MKDPIKSLDELTLIADVLRTVSTTHDDWLKPRELRSTVEILRKRITQEGLSVLTIALPRLGKSLDRVLAGVTSTMVYSGWAAYQDCLNREHNFPAFLGELFRRVLSEHGTVLPSPCVVSVRYLRQVLYMFYKYDLPYADELKLEVIQGFKTAENEVESYNALFEAYYKAAYPAFVQARGREIATSSSSSAARSALIFNETDTYKDPIKTPLCIKVDTRFGPRTLDGNQIAVLKRATRLLHKALKDVDLREIQPGHGPGAVSTGETLEAKYRFRAIPNKLHEQYPFDAYFCASLGHVVDSYGSAGVPLTDEEPLAKVVLVPKDSRGPRLISEEPLVYQWIQQGIRRALYAHVESHPLTKWNVFFTNQDPNQRGALLGSKTGQYATLDLKEASDRVGLWLVRCLFPGNVSTFLEASRSIGTKLPSGEVIYLQKFAPMGSALCFPVMALTIWSLLTAAAEDTDTRESILVYGDDVIVPTAFAARAIETLEGFGLKANLDKCCMRGSFRESCGVDAYQGVNVTPLRIRKLIPSCAWTSKDIQARPEVYLSWLAYARRLWVDGYYWAYMSVTEHLFKVYGDIPSDEDVFVPPLSLPYVPDRIRNRLPRRVNHKLQRLEVLTWGLKAVTRQRWLPGWLRLLRFFAEFKSLPDGALADEETTLVTGVMRRRGENHLGLSSNWSSATYTERRTVKLVRRWRLSK